MIAASNGGDLIVVLLSLVCSLAMFAIPLALMCIPIGAMIVLPFRWRETWARWTSGSIADAYENVAEGSTTGPVQIWPASYLHERTISGIPVPPDRAIAGLVAQYTNPLTTILARDDDGVAVDIRIPSGLGPGWIAVFKVAPDGEGSQVHARLRSTMCLAFPVLTLFLAMTWHLHLDRIVRTAATKAP